MIDAGTVSIDGGGSNGRFVYGWGFLFTTLLMGCHFSRGVTTMCLRDMHILVGVKFNAELNR